MLKGHDEDKTLIFGLIGALYIFFKVTPNQCHSKSLPAGKAGNLIMPDIYAIALIRNSYRYNAKKYAPMPT
jgi:hypothetical protein